MARFKLKDIGRNKFSGEVEISGPHMEEKLYKEVKKHLMSSDVEMVPNESDTGWDVFVGFRKVGEVLDVSPAPAASEGEGA